MGLDIAAYEIVTLAPNANAERSRGEGGVLWISSDAFNRLDDLVPGAYTTSGKSLDFRAGSYSGYNEWRSFLAKLVGTTDREVWAEHNNPVVQATPFFELIAFSDCEGTIGPKTCAKLANDFDTWAERAAKFSPHEYWMQKYEEWRAAFRLAAWRGVIDFH